MMLKEFIEQQDLWRLDERVGVCTPTDIPAVDSPIVTIEHREPVPDGWTVQFYVADVRDYLKSFDYLPRDKRAEAVITYLAELSVADE